MGCFLGCFGGSKDRRCHKKRNKVSPREHQLQKHKVRNPVSIEQGNRGSPPENLVSEFCDKPEETTSSASKKRVTFNSNVTTFEHAALLYESTESFPDYKKFAHIEKDEILSESNNFQPTSDDGSFNSSIGSYLPNDRYQNCRDSDDEDEECGDSYLDDIDDNEESFTDCEDEGDIKFVSQEVWSESVSTESFESTTKKASGQIIAEEVESPMLVPVVMHDQEVKTMKLKGNVRDRSDYVHPVLNPVENLTQWKTVKSRGTPQLKPQKENFTAEVEVTPISLSSEPTFKKSSSINHPKSDQYKNLNQDVAVDTSLSTWLSSPGSTHIMSSPSNRETVTSQKFSMSQGSLSAKSFEDRPILGAMTVEELKHLSASTSPRKSPCRSPDEMPIIGTVGTYWNESMQTSDSQSALSFKGIPNTTSKYREDKRVNWHSTPFETRLERALNRAGES